MPAFGRAGDLPDLPEPAAWLAVGLVLVLWIGVRVRILRRRQARRGADDPLVPAWRWLRALAAWPGSMPLLVAIGALLAVALASVIVQAG